MTPRLSTTYSAELTGASRAALLELARALRPYRDSLVLVGGWVPNLLLEGRGLPGSDFMHVGSIDIDFVVDPEAIGEDEYATIVELISGVGWRPCPGKRFSYERAVVGSDGRRYEIQVDFLTISPGEADRPHRHRAIQVDLEARTMRGAELALTHCSAVRLTGRLPGGADSEAEIKMLDVTGCLGTKAIALGERFKHKDAYDIVSVASRYGTGVSEVADLLRPSIREPLVAEAISTLRAKFRSDASEGPVWYAEFIGGDVDARERSAQRAFQVIQELDRRISQS